MIMKPEISIIVPAYNSEKTLERCLDSVLCQSFQNFEVILVNDGSRDSSGQICDRYAECDSRIHVIHQKNAGVSAARNAGLAVTRGSYTTFLDSDDYLMSSHLEQYYHAACRYDCDIVVGGFTCIAPEAVSNCLPRQTGVFGREIWEEICRDPAIYGYLWNKLFRTSLLHSNGIRLCEAMYSQEDLDFCLSAFGVADTVAQINSNSYQYDYAPGKRIPPYWDYLANKMKMLRLGSARTELSAEAQACIHKQILSLLYTGLYQASEQVDYDAVVVKIASVEELTDLLATLEAKGEHGFVARNFTAGRYDRIRRYFQIRNRIRNIVRAVRGKKG